GAGGGPGGQEQSGAEDPAGVDRDRLAELVASAGEVAQDQSESGDQAPGEAAAGVVVAGEEEEQAQDHHRGEDEPGGDLEDERPGTWIAHGGADEPPAGRGAGALDGCACGAGAATPGHGLVDVRQTGAGAVAAVAEHEAGDA